MARSMFGSILGKTPEELIFGPIIPPIVCGPQFPTGPSKNKPDKTKKRDEEDDDRIEVLTAENKKLSDQMRKNQEEQRARNDELDTQNEELHKQIRKYQKKNKVQIEEMNKLLEELKKRKLNTFEDIGKYDKEAREALIKLAKQAEPIGMQGNNVALFGNISVGKSTMLNALYGEKVAETGIGETTVKTASYTARNFVLWDIPGKNDQLSYMNMEYISFFKGLTRRLILVTSSLKENSSMMELFDAIGLDYDIVVNKMDQHKAEQLRKFREQIEKEKETLGLKGLNRLFFVSAEYPEEFDDWLEMVDHLTNPRKLKR